MHFFELATHFLELAKPISDFILTAATIALAYFTVNLVTETKRSSEASLRAYLGPHERPTITDINTLTSDNARTAKIKIENYGKTPAFETRVSVGLKFLLNPPTDVPKAHPPNAPYSSSTLWPKQSVVAVAETTISEQEWEAIRAGHGALYLFGYITYKDAFKKPRWTTFMMYQRRKRWLNARTSRVRQRRELNFETTLILTSCRRKHLRVIRLSECVMTRCHRPLRTTSSYGRRHAGLRNLHLLNRIQRRRSNVRAHRGVDLIPNQAISRSIDVWLTDGL